INYMMLTTVSKKKKLEKKGSVNKQYQQHTDMTKSMIQKKKGYELKAPTNEEALKQSIECTNDMT
ncbi:21792_t:CDS:2, partial [Gigaspora rosea]